MKDRRKIRFFAMCISLVFLIGCVAAPVASAASELNGSVTYSPALNGMTYSVDATLNGKYVDIYTDVEKYMTADGQRTSHFGIHSDGLYWDTLTLSFLLDDPISCDVGLLYTLSFRIMESFAKDEVKTLYICVNELSYKESVSIPLLPSNMELYNSAEYPPMLSAGANVSQSFSYDDPIVFDSFTVRFVYANPVAYSDIYLFPVTISVNPYTQPNTGAVDDYEDAEGAVIDTASGGLDVATGFFDDVETNLFQYVGGFQAMAKIVDSFMAKIPWLSALLTISISVGIFGFILGMIGRAVSHGRGDQGDSGKNGKRGRRE